MNAAQLKARADRVWGARRILTYHERPDGGLDLTCIRLGRGETRGRALTTHTLNLDGDPVCHPDCAALAVEQEVS